MLRHSNTRHSCSRLLSYLHPGSAAFQESAACRARGILPSTRLFSAAPAPEEELRHDSEEAAAAHKAVHERLVFELFGIREKVRANFAAGESPGGVPRRIRREDEPILYVTPLRELLKVMQGSSKEEDAAMLRLWERQIDSETNTLQRTVERYKESVAAMEARGERTQLPAARRLILRWYEPLRDAIHREQQAIILKDNAMVTGRHIYGPFLLLLPPDQLAVITLHATIMSMMLGEKTRLFKHNKKMPSAGINTVTLMAIQIGRAVQKQVSVEQIRVRVELENTKRQVVSDCLEGIMGEENFAQLNQGGTSAQVLRNPRVLKKFQLGFEQIRASTDLPDDAQEWLESLDGMTVHGRLDEIRKRYRISKYSDNIRLRYGYTKLTQAEKRLWDSGDWTQADQLKIGTALLNQLLQCLTVEIPNPEYGNEDEPRLIEVPAFVHKVQLVYDYDRKKFKRTGKIVCHDVVMHRLEQVQEVQDLLTPKFQPMLIPPLPWRSHDSGGHLIMRGSIMRVHTYPKGVSRAIETAQERTPYGLSRVYDALNAVGEVPWAINKPMLAVVERAWAAQLPICGLPVKYVDQKPQPKSTAKRFRTHHHRHQLQLLLTSQETGAERTKRMKGNRLLNKRIRETHSLRCDLNLKLGVANEFKDELRFYFPHNLDFRGRAYPLHPHLNHMGPDVCRGLLTFAEARPLGPDGIGWLYVLIANSWGKSIDKMDFEGRRQFAQRNLEAVLDSAERPLDGHRWWTKGEKPWQLLAACMEVRDALASGNPAAYLSRLPVQIDGSCNGLQHYAALGRDKAGGSAVNLRPAPAPQDVYGEIAVEVNKMVAADAEKGVPEALALQGHINRKLVKQTVMTSVYGVTYVGARQQIQNRLLERGWSNNDQLYRCASYAARLTLQGLEEKFDKAVGIMRWLGQCASIVASQGNAVAWHTPLGLPVLQPYREKYKHVVQTVLQRLILMQDREGLPVLRRRQKSAFPPNYVHSLDSTHMMMTALACKQAGIAFAGVHDSFWTHAGDTAVLARKLRETFVELHSQPLLAQLLSEMKVRYPELAQKFPPLPETGELDLNEVLDAEYFFG